MSLAFQIRRLARHSAIYGLGGILSRLLAVLLLPLYTSYLGTEGFGKIEIVTALEQLPVDLDIVEGVPHEEARARYARADIVVDQLNAGWHGVFALESMALGKPVVTYLKPDVVEKSAAGYGIRIPIVPATAASLADAIRPLVESPALRRQIGAAGRAYVEEVHDIDRVADRLIDVYRSLLEA